MCCPVLCAIRASTLVESNGNCGIFSRGMVEPVCCGVAVVATLPGSEFNSFAVLVNSHPLQLSIVDTY